MDDIYFTDKKGRRNGKKPPSSNERFTQSEYDDINSSPSLQKRTKSETAPSQRKNFRVNIPEENLTVDRTPQGRRRSDIPAPPPSRKRPAPTRIPSEEYDYTPSPAPGSPSRNPKSAPVAPRKKKKRRIAGKLILVLFLLVTALIIGAFAYGYSILGEIDYDDSIVPNSYINEAELLSSPSVKNILFIGSDARDYDGTEGQRSDSMILFSIDKQNKQIKLTSFLRDSYVYIPSEDYYDKLNASYSYGGAQLTMDTIEYNFGVDIDNYIIIDFNIFTQLVDLLGGITIDDISENEVYYMTNTLSFDGIVEGKNTLNGYRALWYCRMRTLDDDFHRTERQRKVIKAVIKQAASTNPLELMEIVKQIVPNISTDIPQAELLSLGVGAALSFIRYDIVQQQIPAEGTWAYDDIDGASVISINLEPNREVIKSFIFDKYDPENITTFVYEEEYYDDEDYYYDEEDDYNYDDYY